MPNKSQNFEMLLRRRWPGDSRTSGGDGGEDMSSTTQRLSLAKLRNMVRSRSCVGFIGKSRLPQGCRPNPVRSHPKGTMLVDPMPKPIHGKLDILRQYGSKAAHGEKCGGRSTQGLAAQRGAADRRLALYPLRQRQPAGMWQFSPSQRSNPLKLRPAAKKKGT